MVLKMVLNKVQNRMLKMVLKMVMNKVQNRVLKMVLVKIILRKYKQMKGMPIRLMMTTTQMMRILLTLM